MSGQAKERALDRIAELAGGCGDLVTFWRESSEALGRAVPYYWTPCWYTLDPASLLVTSHFHEGMAEIPAEWLADEYYSDDVHKLVDVVRSAGGISTLHDATNGDPSSSPRWHANMELGGDQEMLARLATPRGDVWGALGLYRAPGSPMFDAGELAWIRAAAPHLAEGVRRSLLVGQAADPEGPDSPGLVVLTEDWEVESATPGVERWVADLPDGDWDAGTLPPSVLAVAGRARRTAEGRHAGRRGQRFERLDALHRNPRRFLAGAAVELDRHQATSAGAGSILEVLCDQIVEARRHELPARVA